MIKKTIKDLNTKFMSNKSMKKFKSVTESYKDFTNVPEVLCSLIYTNISHPMPEVSSSLTYTSTSYPMPVTERKICRKTKEEEIKKLKSEIDALKTEFTHEQSSGSSIEDCFSPMESVENKIKRFEKKTKNDDEEDKEASSFNERDALMDALWKIKQNSRFSHFNRNYRSHIRKEGEQIFTDREKRNYAKNVRELAEMEKERERCENYLEKMAEKDKTLKMLIEKRKQAKELIDDDSSAQRVKEYEAMISDNKVIKFFNSKKNKYIIISENLTESERRPIILTNIEILKFVHSFDRRYWPTQIDLTIAERVEEYLKNNENTGLGTGEVSIVMDLEIIEKKNFPPLLISRQLRNGPTLLLKPVIIDGIAIQYLSSNRNELAFRYCYKSEEIVFDVSLGLNMKPLFDVVIEFLLRGHKVTVYYPMYYKNYIMEGGMSKVDNIITFKTMVEVGLIQFKEIESHHQNSWFRVMKEIVDGIDAVFVSTTEYDKTNQKFYKYRKSSERILQPTFVDIDEMMVLDTSVRYKINQTTGKYAVIPSEEILYYANVSEQIELQLREQLYLDKQVEQICNLCQLYPLKALHKVSVKQLLFILVYTNSNIKMPGMEIFDLTLMLDGIKS